MRVSTALSPDVSLPRRRPISRELLRHVSHDNISTDISRVVVKQNATQGPIRRHREFIAIATAAERESSVRDLAGVPEWFEALWTRGV